MNPFYKCENCGTETVMSGPGPRHLGCQSCGCDDIKFNVDVLVSIISSKDPGEVHPQVLVKKDEPFLGAHAFGHSWNLSFPIPETVAPTAPLIKLRKKGKGNDVLPGNM